MTSKEYKAVEMARNKLTALHGLIVVDGAAPQETWTIDTSAVVAAVHDALNDSRNDRIQVTVTVDSAAQGQG